MRMGLNTYLGTLGGPLLNLLFAEPRMKLCSSLYLLRGEWSLNERRYSRFTLHHSVSIVPVFGNLEEAS